MPKIEFEVRGEPKAQMRHRHFQRGEFKGSYDPSEMDKKNFLLTVQEKAPKEPFIEPIAITLVFYVARPQNHYGTGRNKAQLKENAPEFSITRPDIDNYCKLIFDALNGVFWKDDSQICHLVAVKKYSERPRTGIVIETL